VGSKFYFLIGKNVFYKNFIGYFLVLVKRLLFKGPLRRDILLTFLSFLQRKQYLKKASFSFAVSKSNFNRFR